MENEKGFEIKIPIPVKSIKEISFIIQENKKETQEIINDLVISSNLQKKKIEEQDIIIKELQLKLKYLDDENKKIKNELKEIINKLKRIEDKVIINPIIESKSNYK